MDILGIGFPELFLILIIAMMIFGPRRLPELAVKAGRFLGELRSMSSGLMTEWQREITAAARLEELEKTRQEFRDIQAEVQQTRRNLAAEASSSMKTLAEAHQEVTTEVKSASAEAAGAAPRTDGSTAPDQSPAPAETGNNGQAAPPAAPQAAPDSPPVEVTGG